MRNYLAAAYLITTSVVLATANIALAQTTSGKIDCEKFAKRDCRKDVTLDAKEVLQCIHRGYDPPLSCRNNSGRSAGVTVGGSSGFSYGTVQAPQNPPGARGAAPSVSNSTVQNSFGFPPWPGFPCILPGGFNLCATGATPGPQPNPNDPCPPKNDTTGLYGAKQPVAANASLSLPCGGALPLTNYEITLNKNPDRLASTEYNSFHIWLYEKVGNEFKLKQGNAAGGAFTLPKFLCKNAPVDANGKPIVVPDIKNPGKFKERDKTVDLTPPIAQTITYSPNDTSITLRLISRELTLGTSPQQIAGVGGRIPPYDPDDPEKFLILPIKGGKVEIPENCAEDKDYYKEVSKSKADIVIETATGDVCEGAPILCGGTSTTPVAPAPEESCDVAAINLQANNNAPAGCDGKTQLVVLDRANLLYPPGAIVTPIPIEGRTSVLAPTIEKSKIYMQTDAIVRLGKTSPPITLTEGGIMAMQDGSTLVMSAPATVDPASGKVTLTNGGMLKASSGSLIKQFSGGTDFTAANAVVPMTINVKRSMNMPLGYLVPTQPNPYVQLPIPKP